MKKSILLTLLAVSLSTYALPQQAVSGNPVYTLPDRLSPDEYLPNTIVFKLKPQYRPAAERTGIRLASFNQAASRLQVDALEKLFPNHRPPGTERNAAGQALVDLSLIYKLTYTASTDLVKAINSMLATGLVEYAEPFFLPRPFYNPNDPNINFQGFLAKINAYSAWDIQTGDTNVVIGIVDTGTDWDHPDLAGNIKYNYADPINGLDDDNDGYTDNYRGWDLADNDNNPTVGGTGPLAHGSHVSGCAAAITDNGTGVASPGFNCKFLPVKTSKNSDPNAYLVEGYAGIVYAADHGCAIINCSWGGGGGGSLGQNAIDYATINQNALVVCAAGNDGSEILFYPASYKHALSVASVNSNDTKSGFSNFGINVDVSAPGSNIYSTYYNNSYTFSSGTSMASPIAAGAAAIIKSQFPTLSGLQVGERLRMGCDNIYGVGGNGAYAGKLGKGRINMHSALVNNTPAVRLENEVSTDMNDDAFVIGDTIRIYGDFINYLDPTSNLNVTLSTTSTNVTILNPTVTIGALATMATFSNISNPFEIKIDPGTPQNSTIYFRLDYMDGLYTDFQYLQEVVNVDYINITINDVHTTITSKGRLCWNGTGQTEGLGFYYNNNQLDYEAGLMIGNNGDVSDNVRAATGSTDDDFLSQQVVQRVLPAVKSEFDLTGMFNDNPAASSLNVLVTHQAYAWSTPGNTKFVIVEYHIRNNGFSGLTSLYAGIFTDWDIMDYSLNRADEDPAIKLGYNYSTQASGLYAGVKVLTGGPFIHYAIDNINGGAGGVDMFNGYTSTDKYLTLSTNRPQAGQTGNGNDVCDVVSTGPFSLSPGDSVIVAFALIAGDDLQDLVTGANNAQIKYNGITGISLPVAQERDVRSFPNPASDRWVVAFTLKDKAEVSLRLFSADGQEVASSTQQMAPGSRQVEVDISHLASGAYHYALEFGSQSHRGKMVVVK